MPDYLVESYQPGRGRIPPETAGCVRRVHTLHLPVDEVSLHVFRAPSRADVQDALDRISFPYERIVEAISQERGEGR